MARKSAVIEALIAKHEASIAKLREELAAAPSEYVPAVDETVRFIFGRADTKKELIGKVLAVTSKEDGIYVTVLTGEGADTSVKTVAGRYVKPLTVESDEAEAEPAEAVAE